MDALIYATFNNQYETANDITNFSRILNSDIIPTSGTTQEKKDAINDLLDETTIKRACCLGKDSIDVRIPIPTNINLDDYEDRKQIFEKYGYFTKNIKINREKMCKPEWTQNYCDNFYTAYCKNQLNIHKEKNKWNI